MDPYHLAQMYIILEDMKGNVMAVKGIFFINATLFPFHLLPLLLPPPLSLLSLPATRSSGRVPFMAEHPDCVTSTASFHGQPHTNLSQATGTCPSPSLSPLLRCMLSSSSVVWGLQWMSSTAQTLQRHLWT